ncbi:MAG: FeoA family protein [Eubacteriales bacterium]|nr:FeoA family protein [Eubacteriales bacterium]
MICKKTMAQLAPGQTACVSCLHSKGPLRRRLLDIGLMEGTVVECVGCSPCGDPKAYLIRDAVIALRKEDCGEIAVR